jgi:uncharacterized protein
MKFGLTDEEQAIIYDIVQQFPAIDEVIIFGSRALGNYKKGSDVDIALKGKISNQLVVQLKSQLEQETTLPYFFDIVDYHALKNEDFLKHIDQYGIRFDIS